MRQLTRYVLFEMIAVFTVTLTGITLLLILVGVAKEGAARGSGPRSDPAHDALCCPRGPAGLRASHDLAGGLQCVWTDVGR